MERLFTKVIKHRKLILIIAAIAMVASIIALFGTTLNSDVSRYLPDSSISKQTISILHENFDINGDAEICAEGTAENYEELSKLVAEVIALDSVADVQWLGSYGDIFEFDGNTIVSADALLPDQNIQKLTNGLFVEYEGKNYYIITISLVDANSSEGAGDALGEIDAIFADYGLPYSLGGNAVQSNDMLESALGDLPKFVIVALIIILIILVATSSSIVSALIFLITIGLSIVLNLGTNFFTSDVSTITFSVAAILQMALSMDYSIFLTHSFEKACKTMDDKTAMIFSIKKTLTVIAASALTTIAGFCALFAMKYTLGADLGLCLAKGVAFSFLTVVFVQPCLMLCLRKACDKTKHKYFNPSMSGLAKLPKKLRLVAPILTVVLFVPAVIFSLGLNYYYLDSGFESDATGPKAVAQSLGNQSIFIVEVVSDDKQFELAEELGNIEGIGSITGYYSLIQDVSAGIEIPIYSSLEDQNDDTLLLTLKPTVNEILDMADGDTSTFEQQVEDALIAEMGDSLTPIIEATVTEAVQQQAPAAIAQAITEQSVALGRVLSQEEQMAISAEVSEELTAQIATQVTEEITGEASAEMAPIIEAQLGGMQDGFSGFTEQFDEYRDKFFSEIDGTEYTFFTLKMSGVPEGEQAFAMLETLNNTIVDVLGTEKTIYSSGNTQTVSDLEETTETDLFIVSALSAVLILIILFFTFKSFWIPVLLVILIELAILINLSISTLMGSTINFMSYIIISAIQLGSTIDYAILMTKNYRVELNKHEPYEAIKNAIKTAAFPIIISVSILCGACLSVYFISADMIIREITLLIARGAFISGIIVIFILPAILPLVTRKKKKDLSE